MTEFQRRGATSLLFVRAIQVRLTSNTLVCILNRVARLMSAVASKLEELIAAGWNVSVPAEFGLWRGRVRAFLFHALSPDVANGFERTGASEGWYERRPVLIGMLEALALGDGASSETNEPPGAGARGDSRPHSRRVFVVHGRDTEAKGSAARFIEWLGLEPVILHE